MVHLTIFVFCVPSYPPRWTKTQMMSTTPKEGKLLSSPPVEGRTLSWMREATDKAAITLRELRLETLKASQRNAVKEFVAIMLKLEAEGQTRACGVVLQCNRGIPTALELEPREPRTRIQL